MENTIEQQDPIIIGVQEAFSQQPAWTRLAPSIPWGIEEFKEERRFINKAGDYILVINGYRKGNILCSYIKSAVNIEYQYPFGKAEPIKD